MQNGKISSGSYDLNKWLFGGYERDVITTIYGPAGSGKTTFCLLVAVSQSRKSNKVIFMDTEGGFSVDRFKQLAGENYLTYLNNITLLKPTSFNEQRKSFYSLSKSISKNISLIIIDSITMLYRAEIADAILENENERVKSVNRDMANQLRILSEISRKKLIPIIVTNQVYYDFLEGDKLNIVEERPARMVGGDLLKYWSKCIIELKNFNGKRIAILKKHRSLPEKELNFIIDNSGIRKRGLF